MSNDIDFIKSIRKMGNHAEDNLAMCDVLHLIKMVYQGDLVHIDEVSPVLGVCEELISADPDRHSGKHPRDPSYDVNDAVDAEVFDALQSDARKALKEFNDPWIAGRIAAHRHPLNAKR